MGVESPSTFVVCYTGPEDMKLGNQPADLEGKVSRSVIAGPQIGSAKQGDYAELHFLWARVTHHERREGLDAH